MADEIFIVVGRWQWQQQGKIRVLHCEKDGWRMGGNTISRGNVSIFSKNRTDVQLFCGNSAEHIFCLQDRICLQDRFGCLIILPLRAENIERCTGLFCILRSAKIACAECLTLSSARFSLSKFFSVLLSLLFCKNSFHSAQNTVQDI